MTPVINNKGIRVGMIDGNVLKKIVQKSKHFMKVLNAWGMDKEHLELPFIETRLLDKESDQVYVATKEDWKRYGIRRNFGYGDQIFLSLNHFSIVNRKQKALI